MYCQASEAQDRIAVVAQGVTGNDHLVAPKVTGDDNRLQEPCAHICHDEPGAIAKAPQGSNSKQEVGRANFQHCL